MGRSECFAPFFWLQTFAPYMKRLLLATLLIVLPLTMAAQVRLSVDERSVQVADGKKKTSERSIYLHPDGRMIVEQRLPNHSITHSNALGEMRIYTPEKGEVVVINDPEVASTKELVALFASGGYTDMALPAYGYTQSSVRNENGVIIKTFTPKSNAGVSKVELAFRGHLPICMIYYNSKGETLRKVYFAQYEYGRFPMPMRVTEIEYGPKRDSLVRLSTYSNLLFDADANSEMFDWQVPADAKRIDFDPNTLFAK